jgi:hypothetical protein
LAQQLAAERGYEYEWIEMKEKGEGIEAKEGVKDGGEVKRGLQLYWTRPATMREKNSEGEDEGEEWWFNQASNVFSFKPSFGNAKPISDDEFEQINEALWKVLRMCVCVFVCFVCFHKFDIIS